MRAETVERVPETNSRGRAGGGGGSSGSEEEGEGERRELIACSRHAPGQ